MKPLPLARRAAHWSALLIIVGCDKLTGPSETELLLQLEQHRAFWHAHEPAAYSFEWSSSGCFCVPDPIRLTVLNHVVIEARDAVTGQLLTGENWPAIDGIFDEAEAALREHVLDTVTFDMDFGFPARYDYNQLANTDAGGSRFVKHFQDLPIANLH